VTRILLLAAEPSGDQAGKELCLALRAADPDADIIGAGGPAMASVGLNLPIDLSGLSVLGFVEGIKAYRRVVEAADAAVAQIIAQGPDAVVLIDSYGFMLRVGQRLKAQAPNIRRIKYIGPQVWATRPGRAKVIADAFELLLCIHTFEQPLYAGLPIQTVAMGNPAVSRTLSGDAATFRSAYGLEDKFVLGILPGSRASEIARVLPTLGRAACRLAAGNPNLRLVCVVSPNVTEAVHAEVSTWPAQVICVDTAEKASAFLSMDAALACSGTVTTELGLAGVPMVVAYKMGWITWALARFLLYKAPYVTLMNMAANAEVAPEFIQTKMTPTRIAQAVQAMIDDPAQRAEQARQQNVALDLMGRNKAPAAEVATGAILDFLSNKRD
jgi:lipid-A-disaccharide synthase